MPGRVNDLADDLSCNRLLSFLSKAPYMDKEPSRFPAQLPPLLLGGGNWMSTLDPDIHYYFERGLADSTHRAYQAGVNRYILFCCLYNVLNPFPVSESMLCYFVVALAREGLAPSTIKTYLAAVRHTQIERGLPDLREGSSLPRLHMVQNGIRRQRAEQGPPPARLPITPAILNQIRGVLLHEPIRFEDRLIWAAAATCFFVFFQAGEITVPTETSFGPAVHLAWGDVGVTNNSPSRKIRIILKRSKTDQFGRGVAVWVGSRETIHAQ